MTAVLTKSTPAVAAAPAKRVSTDDAAVIVARDRADRMRSVSGAFILTVWLLTLSAGLLLVSDTVPRYLPIGMFGIGGVLAVAIVILEVNATRTYLRVLFASQASRAGRTAKP